MKKKRKEKLKKGIYIAILIVFTAVSVLPAANLFTDNNTTPNAPIAEEQIKEMFGENAVYDSKTGTITYTDEDVQNKE